MRGAGAGIVAGRTSCSDTRRFRTSSVRPTGSSPRSASSSGATTWRCRCSEMPERVSTALESDSTADCACALLDRARRVPAARTRPRTVRHARRRPHRPDARIRLALRHRPRPGTPVCLPRRLSQLREAHVPVSVAAPFRRDRLRAGRHPGEQAPSRHGSRASAVFDEAVHGRCHIARESSGLHRHAPPDTTAAARTGSRRRKSRTTSSTCTKSGDWPGRAATAPATASASSTASRSVWSSRPGDLTARRLQNRT